MEGGRKTKIFRPPPSPPPRPPFADADWGADKGQLEDRELGGAAAAAPDRPGMLPNPTEPEAAAASAPPKKKRNIPGTPDPDVEVIALSPGTLMVTNRFLCEVCGKGFQRDHDLQLHRRGHNFLERGPGAAPPLQRVYVCPEPGCVHHSPAHALGDLTGIKKHFHRKHGEKRWACPRCGKRYAVQDDLKVHAKTCGTREYRCDCGTLFTRRDSFVTHRAFCGALVEETGKVVAVPALPSPRPPDLEEVEENVDKEKEEENVDKHKEKEGEEDKGGEDQNETSAVTEVHEPQPQRIPSPPSPKPQEQQPMVALVPNLDEQSMEVPVCALADAMFRLPAKLDRLLASHGHTLPRGAKDEIPLIKQDLQEMVASVQEHDDSGGDDRSMMVKCLTKEVRELSYDMEDTVDQYEHAACIRKRIAPRRKNYKVTRRRSKATSGLQEKLKWRLWMANKIREFSLRSQEALRRCSLFNHLGGNGTTDPAIGGTSSNACPRRAVSFGSWHPMPYVSMDEHVNKLEALLGKDGEQKLKVVCVVGSGGIGKTTLAKELYRRIKGQFECRAFVRTSRKPDVRRLLSSMLSQIQPHHSTHNWKVHSLIADIRTHLQDKRYLIVIDDVWTTQTWDIIVNALPDGNLCSGILITTEVDDVALKCCGYESNYVHTMKPLGHDDSSKLFFSTAFGPQHDCPPELSEVANNIIRKCDGLPLAVVTVASLLVNQLGKPEQWDYVNKSLGYGLKTNPNSEGMKQVLNLSYNNLPQHLKACVMYLSIYEENYMIGKDDLLKQWIAEGLIRANEEKDMEEISRICFDELVNSRMIQPIHINDNDDVLSCTVHHMVLDFIKHKSLEENFVTTIDHCQTTAWLADKVRRLSLHFGNAEAMPPTNMILSQVRTLAFFGVIKCLPSIVEFGFLQVLILHLWGNDECISVDLTGISELFRLRYLHVTCNGTLELEVPQNQMRGLQYLETLKIDARVSAVPLEIIHVPCLLHLSLPVETNLPNGIGSMTSLSTLGYFDLSVNSIDNVQSLGALTNLRDLQLTCSTVPSSCLEEKMDNMGSILMKLSNLRSVTLEPSSIMDSGPSSISCDGLSSISSPPVLLQRFEWLPCICSFSSIPKWIGHLNKLCILKIGVRELTSYDVDVLGGLPALTVLSLYVRGKPTERIVFTKIGFSVLKCFKFRCSVPLLGFEVGAMPNLLKLKLGFDAHGVDQLGTIAVDIMHLIGLKEISAKIGGAGAIDPFRRAAESALIDAIKMHPARPTFNIQCSDGMFSGKDDNDSRVQEEEHMTMQKQYDIMEED